MQDSLTLVYGAVDQINAQIFNGTKVDKNPDTLLLDANSGIDSLTLVNLVVALEQLVFDKTGKSIVIVDETVFSSPDNPFGTLGKLANHLESLMK